MNANFEKQKIAIEHTIRGLMSLDRRYAKVLRAFEIAKVYHSGTRKDGKTPEFKHQLNIAGCILNYREMLIDPIETLIAAFTHDVVEDYSRGSKSWDDESVKERLKGVSFYNSEDLKEEFGKRVLKSNNCLSKVINGHKKSYEQYFEDMAENIVAIIVKAEDRLDNLDTMYHVFKLGKQREYAHEVFTYFIPALKRAEINFPEQSQVYQMLKVRLKQKAQSVLDMIETFEKLGLDLELTVSQNLKAKN